MRRECVYTVDVYREIMAHRHLKVIVTRDGDKMVDITALSSLLGLKNTTVNTLGDKIEL